MRAELESLLRARRLDVTLTTTAPGQRRSADDLAATGVASLDEALGGGFRRGHQSEIVGARSSGRTTVLCHTLGAAVARGELVALIDTFDRFDPASAAAAGLDLSKLLWIREAGDAARALKAAMLVLQAGGFGVVAFDLADVRPPSLRAFPFTTWLRLARAIEGSETVALLVASEHLARSPGGVTLALEPPPGMSRARWAGTSHRARLLHGVAFGPRVVSAVGGGQ
jgi:recombination protein RecA